MAASEGEMSYLFSNPKMDSNELVVMLRSHIEEVETSKEETNREERMLSTLSKVLRSPQAHRALKQALLLEDKHLSGGELLKSSLMRDNDGLMKALCAQFPQEGYIHLASHNCLRNMAQDPSFWKAYAYDPAPYVAYGPVPPPFTFRQLPLPKAENDLDDTPPVTLANWQKLASLLNQLCGCLGDCYNALWAPTTYEQAFLRNLNNYVFWH